MIACMSSCALSKDDRRLLQVESHAGLSEAEDVPEVDWSREMPRRDRNVPPLPAFSGLSPLSGGEPSLCPLVHAATARAHWTSAERATPPLQETTPGDTATCPWCACAGAPPAAIPSRRQPWRHPHCPPRAAGATATGPRAGASARARLPCCGWCRAATPRAPTSQASRRASDRETNGVPVTRAERFRVPSRPCPRRQRRRVWRAHSQIERPVSFWDSQREGCGGVGIGGRGRIQGASPEPRRHSA
jgi:hypothetical protein